MPNTYLETERVHLRAITENDGPLLHDLNSDPEVMVFLPNDSETLEMADSSAKRVNENNKYYDYELGMFIATDKETGEYMGWFILRPDKADRDNKQNLEIGYRLKRKFWGKGFATEVSFKLVEKGRESFGATRFYALASTENIGSIRVMQKIGMKFEKNYIEDRTPTENKEAVVYSMTFD